MFPLALAAFAALQVVAFALLWRARPAKRVKRARRRKVSLPPPKRASAPAQSQPALGDLLRAACAQAYAPAAPALAPSWKKFKGHGAVPESGAKVIRMLDSAQTVATLARRRIG